MTLRLYNSLKRQKETFEPLNPPFVGMYVCGPTVYNEVHMGNVRTFIAFDVIYRWLLYSGYKVRYVRNITDVGHLTDDSEEDKMLKQARVMKLEPMEVAQKYTNHFHKVMLMYNCLEPDIEPVASGHMIAQIEAVKQILDKGYAYEVNGSVYFDVMKFNESNGYGKLSGRRIEELISNTRELDGQSEKRNPLDFSIWKKAQPEHIMRWPSPWGEGFPGWHLECSVMSTKYLGAKFDIHGGGMDLKFPHHECEIAQNTTAFGDEGPQYWMHTNMLTVEGTKMSKSLGNGFSPDELVTGDHPKLERGYSPMVVRFFMLQTHYSSTLDFSNEALQAAEKGYRRLMKSLARLNALDYAEGAVNADLNSEVNELLKAAQDHMNDDFNTALMLADLFELSGKINSLKSANGTTTGLDKETFDSLKKEFNGLIKDVLGLKEEASTEGDDSFHDVMELLIELRQAARLNKDFYTSDRIRDALSAAGIKLLDGKEGTSWEKE